MPDIFTSDEEEIASNKDESVPVEEKQEKVAEKPQKAQRVRPGVAAAKAVTRSSTQRENKEEIRHGEHMNPLAAFALDPRDVSFATQGDSETIHLFLRKHFITNVPWIVFSIFLILIPPVILPLLGGGFPFASLLPANAIFILVVFYYIVVFGAVILTSFINWYFNVYIVTNERVIDIDFVNILYKEVSATRLNLIQDVTTKTGGVFGAVFDYGDVFVQTAGTDVNFDFHAVPHPQQVAQEIEKLIEQARKEEGISDLEQALER